ncbi:unnamed protein product [Nesidiocoris tenuis]|uniref:Uncharacterized protein n=1 Tax=Nesidiocoris tenuis TaxID=355587 RepID=A0A6H5HCK4_9HEMI|nr:unnamed protein product [Nesidiocoris tenuis]
MSSSMVSEGINVFQNQFKGDYGTINPGDAPVNPKLNIPMYFPWDTTKPVAFWLTNAMIGHGASTECAIVASTCCLYTNFCISITNLSFLREISTLGVWLGKESTPLKYNNRTSRNNRTYYKLYRFYASTIARLCLGSSLAGAPNLNASTPHPNQASPQSLLFGHRAMRFCLVESRNLQYLSVQKWIEEDGVLVHFS